MQYQQTIKQKIELTGIEPYGGFEYDLVMSPGEPGSGIIFDTERGSIEAKLENAVPSRFSVMLDNGDGAQIINVEHVLATAYAYGIDNAIIKVRQKPSNRIRLTKVDVVPNFKELQKTLCDKLEEAGLEQQSEPRKFLTITDKIDAHGKLIFSPIDEEELIVKAVTDYKPVGQQEKEILITPENYKSISNARTYAKQAFDNVPEWVNRLIAPACYYPNFGIGHGHSHSTVFMPPKTVEEWYKRELMESEIACHTIIDKLGALALLPGRLEGVYLTCKLSNHKHDFETLKRYESRFVKY